MYRPRRSFLFFLALVVGSLLGARGIGVPLLVGASDGLAALGILQAAQVLVLYLHPDLRDPATGDLWLLGAALGSSVLLRALVLMGAGW